MEMLPIYTQQGMKRPEEPIEEVKPKKKNMPKPEPEDEEFDDDTFDSEEDEEEQEEPEEDVAAKKEKRYEQFEQPLTRVSKQEMHKMVKEDAPLSTRRREKNPDEDWEQLQKDYENR